jgi:hypothetical protein
MKTTKGKTKKVAGATVVPEEEKPKSKTSLFWEKYPNGIGTIVNMRAVLR